jgi:hypothetical protein
VRFILGGRVEHPLRAATNHASRDNNHLAGTSYDHFTDDVNPFDDDQFSRRVGRS